MTLWTKKSSISFFSNKAPEGKYDSNLLSLFFGEARLKQKIHPFQGAFQCTHYTKKWQAILRSNDVPNSFCKVTISQ
jgi:hypothetical protein